MNLCIIFFLFCLKDHEVRLRVNEMEVEEQRNMVKTVVRQYTGEFVFLTNITTRKGFFTNLKKLIKITFLAQNLPVGQFQMVTLFYFLL